MAYEAPAKYAEPRVEGLQGWQLAVHRVGLPTRPLG